MISTFWYKIENLHFSVYVRKLSKNAKTLHISYITYIQEVQLKIGSDKIMTVIWNLIIM